MGLLKYNIVLLVLCLCFVFGNGRFFIREHGEGSGEGSGEGAREGSGGDYHYEDNSYTKGEHGEGSGEGSGYFDHEDNSYTKREHGEGSGEGSGYFDHEDNSYTKREHGEGSGEGSGYFDHEDNSSEKINSKYHDLDEPSCFPPCQNNGICIEPGVCQCPEKVEGKQCQFNYNSQCKHYAYYGQIIKDEEYEAKHYYLRCPHYNRCYMQCYYGYQVPGRPYSDENELTCVNEEWYFKFDGNLILPYCEAQPEVVEEENTETESDDTTISTTFSTPFSTTTTEKGDEDEDYTEEDEAVTKHDCSPPCQNNGICVEPGVCQCPYNAKGEQCQFNYNSTCVALGPDVSVYNSEHYWRICRGNTRFFDECYMECYPKDGYQVSGYPNTKGVMLTCMNEEWYIELLNGSLILPSCEAIPTTQIEEDKEVNDEENETTTEYYPNIIQCKHFEGSFDFLTRCSKDENGQHSCSITCFIGYRIPGTQQSNSKDLKCVKGEWYMELDDGNLIDPSCEAILTTQIEEDKEDNDEENETTTEYNPSSPSPPTCSPPCQNNGICVAPDICQCPENIEGPNCEFDLQCKQFEGYFDFLTRCSKNENGQHSCSITCFIGYRIPGTQQSNSKDLKCVKGEWYMELDDGNLIDPSCEVDPSFSTTTYATPTNDWHSSEEVREDHSRSSNECQKEPPMSKNSKLIRLLSDSPQEYKVECLQGYIFPDNTKEQYLVCVDGMWYHKQTGNSKAPDCELLCPGEQIVAETEDCMITCTDLANNKACQNNIKTHCRCPYGEYLNDKDECVAAKDCPCFYDGLTFAPSYKHNRAGEKFLELCTCEDANWNCSSALEGDLQKYPSASDLNFRCEQNPDSCKIKTSIECSEKSTDDNNNNFGFINNFINKLTHSVDQNYQNKLKEITKDSESLPSSCENADEPNIKIMSLNLQSMEIRGGSKKYKEKTIHGLN